MRKRTLHRLLSEGLACVWRKGGTQRGAVGVASVPRATAPFVHSVHLRVRSIVFWRENQSRCDLKNGKLQDITREKGHGVAPARCQSSTMPSAKAAGQLPTEMALPLVLPPHSVALCDAVYDTVGAPTYYRCTPKGALRVGPCIAR